MRMTNILAASAVLGAAWFAVPATAAGEHRGSVARQQQQQQKASRAAPRRTTHAVQRGRPSYYAPSLAGRRTASGVPFDPNAKVAASKTLPLGSTARVTKLENGRSTTVRVEDRGPHLAGRILDVSPRAADDLGMRRESTALVEVAPVPVPQSGAEATPGAMAVTGGGPSRPRR